MKILYGDKELKRLAEDPDAFSKRLGPEVVRAFRRKIQLIANARDERDLRAFKSLHLEQLRGDRKGTSSIRLNQQFRLVLRFVTDDDDRIAVIIEIVDYH